MIQGQIMSYTPPMPSADVGCFGPWHGSHLYSSTGQNITGANKLRFNGSNLFVGDLQPLPSKNVSSCGEVMLRSERKVDGCTSEFVPHTFSFGRESGGLMLCTACFTSKLTTWTVWHVGL